MAEADLGKEALTRLCELLGVEAEWKAHEGGFRWSLWGASQRAWSEPASGSGGWPTWRLQLRTSALEGFIGSDQQADALTAEPVGPAMGGVVRAPGQPTRLELATSLDVRGSSVGCVLWLLAVAARAHAAEARRLSESQRLRAAGLGHGVKLQAEAPAALPPEGLLLPAAPPAEGAFHAGPEMPECVAVLKNQAKARAVQSPRGLIATLPFGETESSRSLLELTTDARHPLLGQGLSAVVRTPAQGLVPLALAQNEREVGPWGRGDALGGWWADRSGLVHTSFYPQAFHPKGLGVEVVLACARRARDLDDAVAGRGPSHDGQDPTSRAVRRWLGSF